MLYNTLHIHGHHNISNQEMYFEEISEMASKERKNKRMKPIKFCVTSKSSQNEIAC